MSQQQNKAEKALAARAANCDKPTAVAKYLSDFADALFAEGVTDGAVIGALLVAATPVVTEYAMKGIFK